MKIIGIENLNDVFSIFHDGGIAAHEVEGENLVLKIEIKYLAERININYRYFRLTLENVKELNFIPWLDDLDKKEMVIKDVEKIFTSELEILSAEIGGELIKVACNQPLPNLGYCGGFLNLKASAALVSDEGGKLYSLNELGALCTEYWDEWANKNKA